MNAHHDSFLTNRLPLNRTRTRVALLLALTVNTLPSLSGESGASVEPQLSVGDTVQPGEFDAIGTLGGCTATLITDNLVLTAAHCVCSQSNTTSCVTRATFTLDDVFPNDNPATPVDESKTRRDIALPGTVRVHPEFGLRGWLREDLAVVLLDQPVREVASSVTPIPVEEPQNTPFVGDLLTLVGYGGTGADCSGPSKGKQKLSLKATASNFAAIRFSYTGQQVCPGDSGGPVLNAAGHVVGVASWGNFSSDSNYRPTSFSYNWIFNMARPTWGSCTWVKVEQAGINSHQPGPQWCPDGSFLTALDLDAQAAASDYDSPVIGQARCCTVKNPKPVHWGSCSWVKVEQQGINSHAPLPQSKFYGAGWCPNGSFITQIDLDREASVSATDSPVIGQVRCCRLAGNSFARWGSSYWIEVGGQKSHQAGSGWCTDGGFLTQFDLDGGPASSSYDFPVVGNAKCSQPRPVVFAPSRVRFSLRDWSISW